MRSRSSVDNDGITTSISVIDGRSSNPRGSAAAEWSQTVGVALVSQVCLRRCREDLS